MSLANMDIEWTDGSGEAEEIWSLSCVSDHDCVAGIM